MDNEQHKTKKTLMIYLWRIQQSQAVISIVFWALTLTGIFYPFVRVKFDNFKLPQEWVFMGMLVMFLFVMLAIVTFGMVYDKLRFWKEQTIVVAERNPYTSWRLTPLNLMWMELWVATAKALPNRTPELERAITFTEAWMNRCKEVDIWTAEMTDYIRDFALKDDTTYLKQLETLSSQ